MFFPAWSRSLAILALVSGICLSGCGKREASSPAAPPAPAAESPKAAVVPNPLHLGIEPGEVLSLGKVMSTEVRRFQYTITNTTATPLRIRSVRAACYCTALVEAPRGTIPPGGSVVLVFDLTGGKLRVQGEFDRQIRVFFAGRKDADLVLSFTGTLDRSISVSPAGDVDLRRLAKEDTPWERKFVISAALPPPQKLVLGPPEYAASLDVDMAQTASTYEVTVRPAAPLEVGVFRERIRIPVVEPAGLPPVTLGFRGTVGPRLKSTPSNYQFHLVKDTTGLEPIRRRFQVSFGKDSSYKVDPAKLLVTVPEAVKLVGVSQQGHDAVVAVDIQPELLRAVACSTIEFAVGAAHANALIFVHGPRVKAAPDEEEEEEPAAEE